MKVAAAHPVRRGQRVFGANRAEHDIGPGRSGRVEQLQEPRPRYGLVVIDESEIVTGAIVETGIAGDRDVRRRAMHVEDLEGHGRAHLVDQRLGTRRRVVVGDDDPNVDIGGHRDERQRMQRFRKFRTAEGADRNIDPFSGEIGHGATFRFRAVRSSRQKPADQAKCITIAERAASGP
ncbi:hypothetical protein D9M68_382130 [compost metagenome]